ncbi:MAG: MFS transporter [Burkholderiales bacterium]
MRSQPVATTPYGADAPFADYARGRTTLVLLTLVFTMHYVDRQILAVLIPPIKAEFGVSDTTLGLLSGFAFTALFSVVGLAMARLADRVDRARVIAAALATFTVATALCGAVTAFWQLVAMRVVVGIGEGGTNPPSHALIADLYPMQRRAAAMGIYSIGPYVGLALAFGAGASLSQAFGWRAAYVVVGGLGIALVLAVATLLRDPRAAVASRVAPPVVPALVAVRAMWTSPALRHLLLAATLATAAAQGMATWMPAWLVRDHGLALERAGIFLALVFGLAGTGAMIGFGRLVDAASWRRPARKPLLTAACMTMSALLWLPPLLATSTPLALALLVLPAALTGTYIGATLAMIQDRVDPHARAFSAAVFLAVTNLVGAGCGPLLVGMASDAWMGHAPGRALSLALLAVPVLLLWSALHFALVARARA